jgi:hypothetical protein
MVDHASNAPTGYLLHALTQGLATTKAFLTTMQRIDAKFSLASPTLQPAPNGSYIMTHQKRN